LLKQAIDNSGFKIKTIVHGNAIGADSLAKQYAKVNNIPDVPFNPDWNIHGRAAGPIRNSKMIDYVRSVADNGEAGLILLWDGKSRGSWDILKKAYDVGLRIWVQSF
jgi:hypothetical protein